MNYACQSEGVVAVSLDSNGFHIFQCTAISGDVHCNSFAVLVVALVERTVKVNRPNATRIA